jgi:ligand-binding sensor domain-containing protein
VPWRYKGHNAQLNSLEAFDHWRAIARTRGGAVWVGSRDYGLWRMDVKDRSSAHFTRLDALPSRGVTALAATEGNTVYVGTDGEGLWRLDADGEALARVDEVKGSKVLQLVYVPTVSPAMLYALTDAGLTVLRGD